MRLPHHSDSVASFPVDPRQRSRLRETENTQNAKFNSSDVDAAGLASDLRRRIRGEVRFDPGSCALYATDGSNYRQVPIGVVIPKVVDDVVETLALARRYGAPVLARGGGTSLAGQCCNVAVVMDFSKYLSRIIDLDPVGRRARVEPGVVLDELRSAAEEHHLTFGPDPSTHNHCTLGGMIGNNSCGVHSVMAGKTDDNIEELEIITYDGLRLRVGATTEADLERVIREGGRHGGIYAGLKRLRDRYGDLIRKKFPDIPRRVSGYNLPWLLPEHGFHIARALVGSECTCVTVLEATVRLVPSPPARTLLVLGYSDVYAAGDHIPEVLEHHPIALEGLDDRLVEDMKKKRLHPEDVKLLPDGGGWLLAEFGGADKNEADQKARALMAALKIKTDAPSMKLFDDPEQERTIWLVRRSGLGATARVPGAKDTWEGWEDSAVPPEKLGGYLRDLRKLFDDYGYACALYGHFGQGCVHTRIDFDLTSKQGIARYRSFIHRAADLVIRYGGSLSGEHGDGQSRGELLPKMFGAELMQAFRDFKSIWDPDWKMNPGKVIDAYRADENLRLGSDYRPPQLETYFRYPGDDSGSFPRATLRCVGVGECRRAEGGTMCPSYRVTREEMHSTRGRAHLLFEMLRGNPLTDGWRDHHVKEALDLCLACKGCKADCPLQVDMATYKAEFLAHYYERRVRPRHAYAMGLIDIWAALAALAPSAANFLTQTPLLRDLVKFAGGIAPARQVPIFAPETFRHWFFRRGSRNAEKPRVLLWPDTFNNYFFPEVGRAAVEVLEAAGFCVEIPARPLCCGRPLYDFGMLDRARRLLMQVLSSLRAEIESGVPLVVLEPSCAAVFRDEMANLLPNDEDARRLRENSYSLSEFLEHMGESDRLPQFHGKALVHGHCHHKAVAGMDNDKKLLSKLGLDYELLDAGCCGMAGSFGFEAAHYDISMQVGELALLPAVRRAPKETLIVADGFSCREQISQATDREAIHTAQLIQMALRRETARENYPEQVFAEARKREKAAADRKAVAMLGAAALAALALFTRRKIRGGP